MSMNQDYINNRHRWWLYTWTGLVMFFLIAPVLIVIPISFSASSFIQFPPETLSLRWYRNLVTSATWMSAAETSFIAAVATTLISVPVGLAGSYGLYRMKMRSRNAIYPMFILPHVIPVVLIAIGLFFLYVKLGLVYSMTGLIIAHCGLAIPFVIVTTLASLLKFDRNQECAAQSLGAHPVRAFMTVVLPQIKPAVAAGALFSFVTSLDEVVIGIFVSGGRNTVLTKQMFTTLRDELDPTIAALSTILILISVLTAAAYLYIMQRR